MNFEVILWILFAGIIVLPLLKLILLLLASANVITAFYNLSAPKED